jgi:rubrerythrin
MDLSPLRIAAGDDTTDLYKKVGESVVNNALKNLTEGSAGVGIAGQVKELAETAKMLSGLTKDEEERLYARLKEEREAREKAEKMLAEVRSAGSKENLEMFKIIIEMMNKQEERFLTLLERLEGKKSSTDGGLLEKLAVAYIQRLEQASRSDPDAEIERRLEQVKKLGDILYPRMSLDDQIKWFTVKEEMDIKKRQADREERQAEERGKMLEQAIGVLAQWAQSKQASSAPAAGPGPGDNPGEQKPLRRFVCNNCGDEMILRGNKSPKLCAVCGTPFDRQEGAAGFGGEEISAGHQEENA